MARLSTLGGEDGGKLALHVHVFVVFAGDFQALAGGVARSQREDLAERNVVDSHVRSVAIGRAKTADRIEPPAETGVFF